MCNATIRSDRSRRPVGFGGDGAPPSSPGGFTLDDIRRHFRDHLGNRLEPLGIQKKPYPWYDGVMPKSPERG